MDQHQSINNSSTYGVGSTQPKSEDYALVSLIDNNTMLRAGYESMVSEAIMIAFAEVSAANERKYASAKAMRDISKRAARLFMDYWIKVTLDKQTLENVQ